MTCRTFGPPTPTEDGGLGTCELCFQGATEQEVRLAQLYLPPALLEDELESQLPASGTTVVAFAFTALVSSNLPQPEPDFPRTL